MRASLRTWIPAIHAGMTFANHLCRKPSDIFYNFKFSKEFSGVKRTKNALIKATSALIALLIVIGLAAVPSEAITKKQLNSEIQTFHSFLREHPKVSTDLQANPALAGNKKYLDKHEDLKKFFKQHPAVQHEVINHPRNVFATRHR